MALKIGIVTTSIREGRVGLDVANWVMENVKQSPEATYELIDLKNYDLPLLGASLVSEKQASDIAAWSKKMGEMDAFIFVTAEYNHAVTGAIKNATDYLKKEFHNKVAGFVGYGSLGGIRAVENFRIILAELQVATVQKTVNFLLGNDFENFTKFKPQPYHTPNLNTLTAQLIAWGNALKNA